MASIGHVAVGLLAARIARGERPRLADIAFWSALSLLPDGDIATLGYIPYEAPFGHRGASHSLFAALVGGVLVGLFARGLGTSRPFRTGVIAVLVLASHGLLDTMTHGGGRGVALLWPFDATRHWAPWRPIPIAPIGGDMLSARGLYVVMVEAALFLPLVVLAWLPSRKTARSASHV